MAAGLGDVRTRLHQQMNGEGKEPSSPEDEEAHAHHHQEQQQQKQQESAYASASADHKEQKNNASEGSKGDSSPVVTPVHETSEADLD